MVFIICVIIVCYYVLKNSNKEVVIPTSSEELKEKVALLDIKESTNDKVTFNDNLNLESNSIIKVWIYSTPIYLGEFTIKEDNTGKYIDGLENIIKNANIENGTHNLLLIMDNEVLGYITIDINNTLGNQNNEEINNNTDNETSNNDDNKADNKTNTDENIVKTETVEEDIAYSTKKNNEVNLLRGKEVTFKKEQLGKRKLLIMLHILVQVV